MNRPVGVDTTSTSEESDTLIWSDQELEEFTHHEQCDIQDWALKRLTLQNKESAREQIPRLEGQSGIYTEQIERRYLKEPEDPEEIVRCVDEIVRCEDPEKIQRLAAPDPEREMDLLRELGTRQEHLLRIIHLTGHYPGLFALQTVPYQWASEFLLSQMEEFLAESIDSTAIWETLEQLGDPRAISPLLEHWNPDRTHLTRTLYFLGRLAGEEHRLPDELIQDGRSIREDHRKLEKAESPEEIYAEAFALTSDPHEISLECTRCRKSDSYEVNQIWMYPDQDELEEMDWDGVVLDRIITCKHCGARDEYQVSGKGYMELSTELFRMQSSEEVPEWIQAGILKLHDGTLVKRPKQGLDHLRDLCEDRPDDREIWMKKGIFARRIHEYDEAETAFQTSLEIEEHSETLLNAVELELMREEPGEAIYLLVRGVQAFPDLSERERKELTPYLSEHLQKYVRSIDLPVTLHAAWTPAPLPDDEASQASEEDVNVTVSGVDLKQLSAWKKLEQFLSASSLLELQLSNEELEQHPTILERKLQTPDPSSHELKHTPSPSVETTHLTSSNQRASSSSNPQQRIAEEKPGRNDPCHCGSGRKYKKCCWHDDHRTRSNV